MTYLRKNLIQVRVDLNISSILKVVRRSEFQFCISLIKIYLIKSRVSYTYLKKLNF